MTSFIPDGWRLLKDGEQIVASDMCFGGLSNGTTGWGRAPLWLVGQSWCEGWCGHPLMVARPPQEGA